MEKLILLLSSDSEDAGGATNPIYLSQLIEEHIEEFVLSRFSAFR